MNHPPSDQIKHHFAGVFLVTDTGKVAGHLRDNKPTIDNPGKVGAFGGTVENGETPLMAVWRELVEEETNLRVDKKDIIHLLDDVAWRKMTDEWEVRHFFWVRIKEEVLGSMEVYEGQGWTYITDPHDPKLIDTFAPIVQQLYERLGLQSDLTQLYSSDTLKS